MIEQKSRHLYQLGLTPPTFTDLPETEVQTLRQALDRLEAARQSGQIIEKKSTLQLADGAVRLTAAKLMG